MKTKSFTLIELLVVIVIIGILAGIIFVSTSSYIDKAKITKGKVFSNSVLNNISTGMVSRWKLNGTGTTTTDTDVWGFNNGTLNSFNFNTVSGWADEKDCVEGTCLKFDGVDDYFSFPSAVMNDFKTFEFWFKANSISSASRDWTINAIFFDNGSNLLYDEFALHLYNSNTLSAGWGGAGYQYDLVYSGIRTNEWYLVTVTVGDQNTYLYINGEEKNIDTATTEIKNYIPSANAPQFGHHPGSYPSFNGLIDDIRIYNKGLSSSEVKRNYIAGLNSLLLSGNISNEEYKEKLNVLSYEN